MNAFRHRILLSAIIGSFAIAGCASSSGVGSVLQEKIASDLTRTSEIASKYGAPEIKQCVDYLNTVAGNGNTLLNEPTSGVISLAVKVYLLKNSAASGEAAFKQNCGAMAAGIMIEAAKNAPIGGQLVR